MLVPLVANGAEYLKRAAQPIVSLPGVAPNFHIFVLASPQSNSLLFQCYLFNHHHSSDASVPLCLRDQKSEVNYLSDGGKAFGMEMRL